MQAGLQFQKIIETREAVPVRRTSEEKRSIHSQQQAQQEQSPFTATPAYKSDSRPRSFERGSNVTDESDRQLEKHD
jgi:hypothetical protein